MTIQRATTDDDILRCFPVLHQLRPHLVAEEFVGMVRRQETEGYQLAMLEEDGTVRAAGCQMLELDSGVQRFDAHRFYLTQRMIISAHHFRLKL